MSRQWWFLLLVLFSASSPSQTRVELLPTQSLSAEHSAKFNRWIAESLSMVEKSLGPLPQPKLPVRLNTRFFATEPVPWGQVERDQYPVGDGLYLIVYRYAKPAQLKRDWTLYHEISHLYLPYLDYASFWLSEGFATYMQNVIMLQNRVYNRSEFIDKLSAGLARGRINTLSATGKLSDITRKMRKNRAFMRVYWTGTAFFIEMYLALQQLGTSLPALIQAFSSCCRNQVDTGKELMLKLDKLQGKVLFSTRFFKYRNRTDFPPVSSEKLHQLASFYGSKPIKD